MNMTLHPSSYPFNLERSVNRYLYENVGPTHKVYFAERAPEDPDVDQWIEMNWISDGYGPDKPALLQLNCRSKVATDPMRRKLKQMRDFVIEKLHVKEMPLFDFADSSDPILVAGCPIYPRLRDSKWLENERKDSIAVYALIYSLYLWRPDILP